MLPIGDLLHFHAARKAPQTAALIYPGQILTWWALDEHANRLARLYESLGVSQDDFVAVALDNSPAFHAAVFAIWKLGATPTILSGRLPQREFSALVELIQPKLLITNAAPDIGSSVRQVCSDIDASAFDASPFASRVAKYWKATCSGGSTGRPKVIVSNRPATFDPNSKVPLTEYKLRPDGIFLNPGPLYHNAPFLFSHTALFTGSTVIGMERFDAEETLRLIDNYRVNWVCFVPTMMHRIWSLPEATRKHYNLSSLDAIWHMASPCPEWLKEAWIEWFGPELIWERYGGTEGFGSTVINGTDWLTHKGSVGRVIGGTQLKVINENGTHCQPGDVGELFFLPAGGHQPSHYLGMKIQLEDDGWFTMGDLGFVDNEGFVYLADRRTDLIIRGGANVYPAEVEAALDGFPDVASSIVIGLPCGDLGARVHAIVEPQAGTKLDLAELHISVSKRLAKYKLPESYEVVTQPLRDEAGKARRLALRDERILWREEKKSFATTVSDLLPAAAG